METVEPPLALLLLEPSLVLLITWLIVKSLKAWLCLVDGYKSHGFLKLGVQKELWWRSSETPVFFLRLTKTILRLG